MDCVLQKLCFAVLCGLAVAVQASEDVLQVLGDLFPYPKTLNHILAIITYIHHLEHP